ncbi:MFS transporter [Halomicroarcula sp. F13]|uniref:MFS transporter n=1 Tax=Haloarcula rubra TaxID=2487747 RepID=A0AAW4PLH6_9EURY|nr:MFS transporter [Halomicroarcula rubra]MBX0321888.1 MFS transporter [Halomicroarcula rubra]
MVRDGDARWLLVGVAAAVMGAAGTYQFVWTTVSGAVGARVGASPAQLGTVFTAYVVGQTLVQFPAGSVRDRTGPRPVLLASALLLFVGYTGLALAESYAVAAVTYGVGGLGCGSAYTVAVNTPVKWFDDRRGLATGVVTMAFGGASVVVIPLVGGRIEASYAGTLLTLGAVVGLVGLVAAFVVRDPDGTSANAPATQSEGPDSTTGVGWRTVVRTWQFWVLFGVMTVVNGVGLMLIGQSVGFTTGLGLSEATATTVASVVALADAGGIVVISGLSDRFGGERTVGVSLVLCGGSLGGAVVAGTAGVAPAFVLLVGATAFFRSPAFAVVPSLVGEYYGRARSSENYALVYSSKVPGGVFGGTVAGVMVARLGWVDSFAIGAGLLVVAGVATLTLRPGAHSEKRTETTADG